MKYTIGDRVIYLPENKIYVIKYFVGEVLVAFRRFSDDEDQGFDFPMRKTDVIPVTPLMEELL
jgi:hypothetical protein